MPDYVCPKHGLIKESIMIIGSDIKDREFLHIYCTYCVDELFSQNIPIVKDQTKELKQQNKKETKLNVKKNGFSR